MWNNKYTQRTFLSTWKSTRIKWFMQDGAPPHSTNAVHEHLTSGFGNRWIDRRELVLWHARSPDLNPLESQVLFTRKWRTYRICIVICCIFCGHSRPKQSRCVCDSAVDTHCRDNHGACLILLWTLAEAKD